MRCLALLIALFVAWPAFAEKPYCGRSEASPALVDAVRKLNQWTWQDSFPVLMEHPVQAACLLVDELKPVKARVITPQDMDEYKTAMHVVWTVRALRHITGCLDFVGPGEKRFFTVWMSRDIHYIAGAGTQAAIIRQWKSWLMRSNGFYEYRECTNFGAVYF